MYEELIEQLRNTESRSKRFLLDAAADAIERLSLELDVVVDDVKSAGRIGVVCYFCAHLAAGGESVYRPDEPYMSVCMQCGDDYDGFDWRGA